MKRILIFGASGKTGICVVEYALQKGYEVIALVRDPDKIKTKSDKLQLITGNPYNRQDVEKAMRWNIDAVISTLNNTQPVFMPWAKATDTLDVLERSTKNAIDAMQREGIKRIVIESADGTGDSYQTANAIIKWMIENTKIGIIYADHNKAEQALQNSGLEWTSVRPVGLNNGDALNPLFVGYQTAAPSRSITRKEVAKFMVDSLETAEYVGKAPTISEAA